MKFEKLDELLCSRIEFASSKKREGPGTTGTDPVFWDGLWEGKIRALQDLREDLKKLFLQD